MSREDLRQKPRSHLCNSNRAPRGPPRMEEYTALIEKSGVFFPGMREVYEAFPNRFTIGMDMAHAPGMNLKNYGQRAQRFRELLMQLTPQTAAAFAERNAMRIFKLDR